MKKIILIIMITLLSVIFFSETLATFLEINDSTGISPDAVQNIIAAKFNYFSVSLRQKITYNSSEMYNPLASGKGTADYGLYIKINEIKKESKTDSTVQFMRDDTRGNYIKVNGIYVQATSKLRYSYNMQKDSYVRNDNGNYIYLANYPWARDNFSKYVVFDGFYSKYTKDSENYKYTLNGFYQFVDFKTGFIISSGTISKNIITDGGLINRDSLIENAINEINFDYKKLYDEKPKIALYINNYSDKNVSDEIYDRARSLFENDGRYVVLDRANLDKLFDEKKLDMITENSDKIASELKNVKYMVFIDLNYYNEEEYRQSKNYFFNNPVSGDYINGEKVVKGIFYSPEKGNDGKTKFTEYSTGNYVRVETTTWDKNYRYVKYSVPQDVKVFDITKNYGIISYSYKLLDLTSGTLLMEKADIKEYDTEINILADNYGSTKSFFKSTLENALVNSAVSDAISNIKKAFPVRTEVLVAEDNILTLGAGKNYGVRRGTIFRIVDNYKTVGYASAQKIYETQSVSEITELINKNEKPEVSDFAYEDFYYDYFFGGGFGFYMNSKLMPGFNLRFKNTDIEKNTKSFVNLSNYYEIPETTETQTATDSKIYIAADYCFNLLRTKSISLYAGAGANFEFSKSTFDIYPVIEINNYYKKNTVNIFFRLSLEEIISGNFIPVSYTGFSLDF
ncbi:MAG TPA: hypothetical protein PLS66_06840 [Tepiditoga sp.]|nr:hypothetical protein [Thermotogota bacterium]HOO74991.1 hypothetical protein [Tepiditoga sp.]